MSKTKKGQTFAEQLAEVLQDPDKTPIIPEDINKTVIIPEKEILQSGEDYLENKRITENSRQKPFAERFYGKEPMTEDKMKKLKMGKYSEPINMGMEPNIFPPESDVSKYITRQQSKAKLFRKLKGVLGPAKNLLKATPVILGPLGYAADVLASEDLGSDEEELQNAKREEIIKRMSPDKKRILELGQENLAKILSPESLLDPKIKELSTMLEEVESPNSGEMGKTINYEDYLKKMKKDLGY